MLSLPLALLLILTLGACEESVNPILDSDRDYTLFGTLDMARDTQFVRVVPIRPILLDPDPAAPLNVTFTSTDLNESETIVWRDSLITFSNGSVGHVFYAPLRIRPSHTYRIEVTPDGSNLVTSAETTVPSAPQPQVLPAAITGGGGGALGRGTQQVRWQGISDQPFRIELWYRFLIAEGTTFSDIRLPYTPTNQPLATNTWEVMLDLTKDRMALDTLIAVDNTPLLGIGLEMTVLDEAFVPPGGVFDPEILVQPGTLSNVDNGLGFVGSVGRFPVEWVLPTTAAHQLRYVTVEDVFGAAAPAILARLYRDTVASTPHPRHHPGLQ